MPRPTLLDDLKTDCRHFRWDRPCAPHKRSGVTCPVCRTDYEPVSRRVLIVKLAALGDVLRTTALLPAVHQAFPRARVVWITAADAVDLFGGNALVDEVLGAGDATAAARLAVERFDVVLCPDAAPAAAALAAAAQAAERRGFSMDQGGRVLPLGAGAEHWLRMGISDALKKQNRDTYQSLIADVLELPRAAVGEPILVPSAEDRAAAGAWRGDIGFAGPLVGLNTGGGARWERKQWALPNQAAFLRQMAGVGVGVVLLGGPAERQRHGDLLAAAAGLPVFDAGNDHAARRFAALVELCAAVVTGDTFALHVATARRVPVVALFGPTSRAEIELYGRGEKIAPEELACLCCYLPTCDVDPHCQQRISADRVAQAVLRWVQPAPQRSLA